MKFKPAWNLVKSIFIKWLDDEPFQSAAALSYYTLFSLAPLFVISIAVAGRRRCRPVADLSQCDLGSAGVT